MTNEKRLIDANELLAKMAKPYYQKCGTKRVPASATVWAAALVNQAPTVDAVEVVHGRWETGAEFNVGDVCSSCYFDSKQNGTTWRHCPNCGAKMDLKGE